MKLTYRVIFIIAVLKPKLLEEDNESTKPSKLKRKKLAEKAT